MSGLLSWALQTVLVLSEERESPHQVLISPEGEGQQPKPSQLSTGCRNRLAEDPGQGTKRMDSGR